MTVMSGLIVAKASDNPPVLHPIGRIESALNDLTTAPKQGADGAPEAWLALDPATAPGLAGLDVGAHVVVLTWLDHAQRDVLTVHPRGDTTVPKRGVFSTRSPHRPNPIGMHPVEILRIERTRILVNNMEAIDGTPILDIKPVLASRSR